LTDLHKKKRGPALKNALHGMANLPNRTLLGDELATENGVEYLLNELRPHFLEGMTNIFLFRMKIFLMQHRGRMDLS
jgi:hypothetical protein